MTKDPVVRLMAVLICLTAIALWMERRETSRLTERLLSENAKTTALLEQLNLQLKKADRLDGELDTLKLSALSLEGRP